VDALPHKDKADEGLEGVEVWGDDAGELISTAGI